MTRMYRITINGQLLHNGPAYSTPLEVQHELSQEHPGKLVRVKEYFIGQREKPRRDEDDEDD
jgi:hypothetical protein